MKRALLLLTLYLVWTIHALGISGDSSKLQIAVILPFCGQQLLEDPQHKNAAIGNACRQYYEGFQLALDSFRFSDVKLECRVYDTKKDSLTLKKILTKKEVQQSNLIFGPLLKEGNVMMLDYCKKNKVYQVSPFVTLTKSSIPNPYLISAYPDLDFYADFMLEHIAGSFDKGALLNLTVISGKENNDKIIQTRIQQLKSNYPYWNIRYLDVANVTNYKDYYKLGKDNIVIVNSENEFWVGSALKHISDTTQFIDLTVYGNRKWLEFKAPNVAQMQSLKVKLVSPFYMDYQDAAVKLFIERYKERFYTEPQEHAVTGYEQGLFFIGNLIKSNGDLSKLNEEEILKVLTNYYKIRSKPSGINQLNGAMNILYFENNRLQREKQ